DNIGSFDPNDKAAFPAGIQEERYLRANTDIEYKIRFQNTGTDTAFNVSIVDTLSPFLDISTLRVGASSHDYEWLLQGRTLTFKFNNIMLPDSNVNEPASHGFVKFEIAQNPDLIDGILITNFVDIYFDFNDPIRTNEVFHTIGQPFADDVLSSSFDLDNKVQTIRVYPNPFAQITTFDLDEHFVDEGQLNLYDARGRLLKRQVFSGHRIDFARGDLESGLYFFQINGDGTELGTGKLLIK
ncbi:MAG: T9SS type A sorting domain-containing protein, partial [Bacteroidota bacterium]